MRSDLSRPTLAAASAPVTEPRRLHLISPSADFWWLGGASIAAWFAIAFAFLFIDQPPIQDRFMRLPLAVAMLALVANHPHFMSSYRFGYGRGLKFVLQNSFALIVVPLLIIAAATAAYEFYSLDLSLLLGGGLVFQDQTHLGPVVMMLLFFSMFATVGWHYSKQIFGCVMTYAKLEGYPLGFGLRHWFKFSVFSLAGLQLVWISRMSELAMGDRHVESRFPAFPQVALGLPSWLETFSWVVTGGLFIGTVFAMTLQYRKIGARPSVNLLTPWVAFYFWWLPVLVRPEFILLIPLFHSVQYYPFVKRMNDSNAVTAAQAPTVKTLKLAALLLCGFLAFEFVPSFLDRHFATDVNQGAWFFMAVFAVFINVHHFFIDSVIWKTQNPRVKAALFGIDVI